MHRYDMTISLVIEADDEEEAIERLDDVIDVAYELHDCNELEF